MLQSKDIEWQLDNKTSLQYAACKKPTKGEGHTQTKSERMEKDISCKWK